MTARDTLESRPGAAVADVPMPQYTPTIIASCPQCLGDCTPEGRDGFHCPDCDVLWTYQQVAYFDEGQDPA